MMITDNPIRLLILFVILAPSIFLGGCFSKDVAPSFYTLAAPQPIEDKTGRTRNLLLGPITLAPHLDQPLIAARDEKNKISYFTLHQWAGRLDRLIGLQLANNLENRLSDTTVTLHPARINGDSGYQVELQVLQFESVDSKEAVLSVQWQLRHLRSGKTVASRLSRIKAPVNGIDTRSLPPSLSFVLEKFSDEISEAYLAIETK